MNIWTANMFALMIDVQYIWGERLKTLKKKNMLCRSDKSSKCVVSPQSSYIMGHISFWSHVQTLCE